MSDKIMCPSCGTAIAVSETLAAQIRQHVRQEFDKDVRKKDDELAKRVESIQQREQQLEASRRSFDHEVSKRVAVEQDRLLLEAATKAQESVAIEIRDLQERLAEAKNKAAEAQKSELQLRKSRRELEEQKRELELTVSRTLDQERGKLREEAKREADEEHRLSEADKDKMVADLRHQIDELKRKSEQGSQQAQGEVMELELEELLRDHFPQDTIEAVPRGTHGGDVLQHVYDSNGLECGSILWESKRTRSWNDTWLPKLRDDQRAAKAHVAVLASIEMPKGVATFSSIDGVWVTNRSCLLGLAAALRSGLMEVARTRRSVNGKQTKIELLYGYFAGSEFRQKIEGIVEAFITLKDDLEAEKRSLHRVWAKREKQLERALINTAGLYGDLGGILGDSLPQITNLELAGITAGAEEDLATVAPWE